MTYDLISFDLDGTLVDTEIPVNTAFFDTLYRLAPPDYRKFDIDYIFEKCMGTSIDGIFAQMAKEVSQVITPEMQAKVIAGYQDIFPGYLEKHLKPDPEQIAILEELSSRFKTCVTSNGMRRNVENSVRIAGLSDIFRRNIFTAEQVANPKPAPDLILYAAERMGVSDLSRVLHIEDAVRGAQAGLAAGATVIGITKHAKDKNKSTAELQNAGVQHVFDNWADIADFALKL